MGGNKYNQGDTMKIKKRITIIADILADEDFDTDFLCICQDVMEQ